MGSAASTSQHDGHAEAKADANADDPLEAWDPPRLAEFLESDAARAPAAAEFVRKNKVDGGQALLMDEAWIAQIIGESEQGGDTTRRLFGLLHPSEQRTSNNDNDDAGEAKADIEDLDVEEDDGEVEGGALKKKNSCAATYDPETGRSFFAAIELSVLHVKVGDLSSSAEKREYADGTEIVHEGERIGDIVGLLGKGGMGAVYKLLLSDGKTHVAAKAVRADLKGAEQRELEKSLGREVAIGFSAARGPQIASVIRVLVPLPDIETMVAGILVLCDLVEGGDLEEAMHSGKRKGGGDLVEDYAGQLYSEKRARKSLTGITRQILMGLDHLHQRGIIHQARRNFFK